MKSRIFSKTWLPVTVLTLLAASAMVTLAEDAATTASVGDTTSASQTATPKLSYGVPEVLQLAKAKIADDTIVSYIKNSGRSYMDLNALEIIYLHQQGVSDSVVAAMLDQKNKLTAPTTSSSQSAVASTATTAPVTSQVSYSDGTTTTTYPQAYVQPTVTYVESAPASTVYIMRDSSPRLVDYGIYPRYPYYGSYYYGYYPSVSFGFNFGGSRHFATYRSGGFHGGGGSFHGSGGAHHR